MRTSDQINTMRLSEETAVQKAKEDLSKRLGVSLSDVRTVSVAKTDFPDMSLGAAASGEISAQMIATGWIIRLAVAGKGYEYRADKSHLRLVGFDGRNYVIS